jgi:hypothetical protein
MATSAQLGSVTIELTSRLDSSIIAKGTGFFIPSSFGQGITDIRLGFVYSTQPILITTTQSISNTTTTDTLVPISGQVIDSLIRPEIYSGTASSINWDYSAKIGALLPNTTYYVRAYCYGYYNIFSTNVNKYGAQFSISTYGTAGGHGYYISDTTVGFYDPLQIREANEGVERVLMSDSSGLATWKPVKSLFSFGHYIGERYGGGIVAAVWREGEDEKVLIVAESDVLTDTPTGTSYTPTWAYENGVSTLIGSSAQSKYNGYLNTAAIVAQSITLGTTYSAAGGAAAYRGGDFEDWYLPAYYELNQVFNNLAIINKVIGSETFITTSPYFTSTEYNNNSAYAFSGWGAAPTSTYTPWGKKGPARVRPVRKESVYTGDGLILNLDATKKNSFSDTDYSNIGIGSKWKDMVNGGMTSSYSFNMSAHPTGPVNSTLTTGLLTDLNTIGIPTNIENLAYRQVNSWWIDKVSGIATPLLYNRTGESSMTSATFTAGTYTYLQFDTIDQSTVKSSFSATVNVYVSIYTNGIQGAWALIRQISNTVGDNNNGAGNSVNISLSHYSGKVISIKITAPNASYTNTSTFNGPSVDNIYVRSTTGGYQPLGPVYLPTESGFLRFNGTGSNTSVSTSYGSYVSFKAPVGNATTVTVEMWARMRQPTTVAGMLFGWNSYDVLSRADAFGFNTGNGDIYGISAAKFQSIGMVEKWAHYVFEMKGDPSNSAVSYTGNKIYINGNLQTLSAQIAPYGTNLLLGKEIPANRNFNGGVGKIGGWGLDNRYLFNGDISVFRVYNRALTKDEIMKNYSFEKKRYEILPTILTNNLLFNIDFDDPLSYSGDGTRSDFVNDLSGGGRTATLTISASTLKPAVAKTSTLYNGKELVFTGVAITSPYLFVPDSTTFQEMTNLSVSFWIKVQEHRTAEIIVKWNTVGNGVGPWEVFQSANGGLSSIAIRLRGVALINPFLTKVGNKKLVLNKWTHVCATYDNITKGIKTYIDGVIDIDSSAPINFSISTELIGDIIVGQYSTTAVGDRFPLSGSIVKIQIYNKSLSSGEVKNNYDADKFRFDNFSDANKFYSHEVNGNPTFSISQNMTLDLTNVSNEKILKLDSMGYSKWVDKSSLFTRPTNYRYIGELYGGGIIVAMWYYPKTIFNYLIMSLEDVSAGSQWSNVTNLFAGATSEFKGETNQTTIMGQGGHVTSAAKLCDDYVVDGFNDWYLPSVFEMNQAFNAASIVDTVLGSDKLDGTYWTSTEPYNDGGTLSALSYSFAEGSAQTGIQKIAAKTNSYRVRAFRVATNAIQTNVWDPTWDEDWTPWWRREWDTIYWEEADWQPARYTPWDFDYYRDWRRTSISIDVLPLVYQMAEQAVNSTYTNPQGYVSMTFSNSIYGRETVLNSGVCWSTTSTTPTLSDSVAYAISGKTTTPNIMGILPGTAWDIFPLHFIYLRAFLTTTTGTYYSSNSGAIRCTNFVNGLNNALYSTTLLTVGTTYSTSPTTFTTYPTGCLVFHRNVYRTNSLYE